MAYRQFQKARSDLRAPSGDSGPVSAAGGETRLVFMGMLALSNISRALTLLIEGFTQQDKQIHKSVRTWVRDFLMSLPTLFFLSTYSVVILFWAQVYYASVLVSFPLLKPIVVFINISVYVVFTVIACLTLLLMAWEEFRQYLFFLLGILFIFCGINFFYYGVKVAAQLSERNKQLSRKSRIIRRVIVLTSSVPVILLARGIYCLLVGLGFLTGSPPWNLSKLSWDALNVFVTEFIPSVLMLSVFWPGSPKADQYEPASSLLSSPQTGGSSNGGLDTPLLNQRSSSQAVGDTPMSEPPRRGPPRSYPHLKEAQERLEKLVQQTVTVIEARGPTRMSTDSVLGATATVDQLMSRPWRKPETVGSGPPKMVQSDIIGVV
jgi:hypothetical protein